MRFACKAASYENLSVSPAEMPFMFWYTANTNHFGMIDFCDIKNQYYNWVEE